MTRTRVVLAALPRMVSGLVRQVLADHPDIEIVAEVGVRADVVPLLATTRAAVAIVGLAEGESPLECSTLLRAYPGLSIVAIAADGRTGYLCDVRVQVGVLLELSSDALLAALRQAEGVHRELHLFSLPRPIHSSDLSSKS